MSENYTTVNLRDVADVAPAGGLGETMEARFADHDVIQLIQWQAVRVSPATVRAFEGSEAGLEVLVFGTHHEDDGEICDPQGRD